MTKDEMIVATMLLVMGSIQAYAVLYGLWFLFH